MRTELAAAFVWMAVAACCGTVCAAQQGAERPSDQGRDGASEARALAQLLGEQPDEAGAPERGLTSLITVHGFINLEYTDFDDKNSGFDLHHANLFVSGDVTDELTASIEVEYEHSSEVIELDVAELRFTPRSYPDLTLAGGRMYTPFGIERFDWYPMRSEFVTRPRVMRQVVPGSWYATGVRGDWNRDLGPVAVRTELAVTNGLGEDANTNVRKARDFRDSNGNRAVSGRLGVAFANGPSFGVSGSTTKYDGENTISFLGFDGAYEWHGLRFVGEYVQSKVEDPTGPVGNLARRGYYVQGGYSPWRTETSEFSAAFRYGRSEDNNRVADSRDVDVYTFGVRYVHERSMVVKFEYQINDARHGLDAGDGFSAQVVLSF